MNPVSNGPHSRKAVAALSKLKWLVVAENFEQETAAFWRDDILALVDKKPEDVQTEVFLLPAANFAEKDGSFVNSARWIQWKWKAVDPPGEAKPDQEIIARIFLEVRELYEKEGGTLPEPMRRLNWWYSNPAQPSLDEVAKEINGWAIADVRDAERQRGGARRPAAGARRRRARRRHRRCPATGSTSGMYTDAGNLTQRRSTADPSGLGRYPDWAFSWPANRRILYNRCSADAEGRPWDAVAAGDRVERAAMGGRRARHHRRQRARRRPGRVHHAARGRGAPLRARPVRRRSVVGALRAGRSRRSPIRCIRRRARTRRSSRSRPSTTCSARPTSIPIVCTTYRLTEHFHYWTKNNPYNVQLQPEFFVEIPEELAREKGIANGDRVRVIVGARLDRRQGDGHAAHQADAGRRQDDLSDRLPDPLGLPRPRRAAGRARQPASRRRSSIRTRSRRSTRASS